MITETKQRIAAYKAALPGLKERITAAALLLVMSLVMIASASYAWVTMSSNPEVSGMSTNVSANGSLEIALVNPEGSEPSESKIGDSSASEGQTLLDANLTWGNLINLSDATYGLQNIALRPARLNDYNLIKTPLYGVDYGDDGRVFGTSDAYEFASYTKAEDGSYYFAAGANSFYGVRAIASVTYENITGNATVNNMQSRIRAAYTNTQAVYLGIISGETMVDEVRKISCMDALVMLMEIYVNEKAENATTTGTTVYYDYSSVVTYTYRLIQEFQNVLEAEGEALLYLANLQAYVADNSVGTERFKTIEELLNAGNGYKLNDSGAVLTLASLETYKSNYNSLKSAVAGLEPLAIAHDPDTGTSTDEVRWSALSSYVNKLVDISTTTVNNLEMNSFTASNVSQILGILGANSHTVVVHKGALKDTEQRIGSLLADNGITVDVTITHSMFGKTINDAAVKTAAASPFLSSTDQSYTFNLENSGTAGDAVAQDTYGMAIDMWVRTNALDTMLTLEGSVIYEDVDVYCTNKNGEETLMYSMYLDSVYTDVYLIKGETDAEGNTVDNWYNAISHTVIGTDADLQDAGAVFTVKQKSVVVGFRGENRVWEDWESMVEAGQIAEDSTTQGGGSCYVFYADNESDQVRILNLLKAFTITFLNQDGDRLATAKLDTENAYIINGKVTVPLKLTDGETYTDENGNSYLGITKLDQNQATWITAVVYLDGLQMTNEDVLAVGEIEGRLNLQYGSSVSLTALKDSALQSVYRTLSASASSGGMTSINQSNPISYEYDGEAKQVTVTVSVDGEKPGTVNGFFVRAINANQGARGDTVAFTDNGDGTWSATFELLKPGSYSFRSVLVDGVEYELTACPTVVIEGLGIAGIGCDLPAGITMTANNYVETTVWAEINADPELMPSQVRAQFRSNDGKEFNATLSYDRDNERWSGTALLTSSGTYTLKYLIMDGDYTELAPEQQSTHIIYLGLSAKVRTGLEVTTFEFTGPTSMDMQLELFDDTGNKLTDLKNVWLYYHNAGSTLDQDGMKAEMTWNAATGYYEGEFLMDAAGIYSFNRVDVTTEHSTSNIYMATSSPVFTAIPPEPPAYDSNTTVDYQFVPSSDATMSVNLYYAQSASVWAVIENVRTGQTALVPYSNQTRLDNADTTIDPAGINYYSFTFVVPDNATGAYADKQDGEWALKELCFQNVFVDGEMYGTPTDDNGNAVETTLSNYADCCYVMDVYDETKTAEENIYTYVVQTVNVAVTQNGAAYTGNIFGATVDSDGKVTAITGDFMDSYDVSGVTFTITDWSGAAIEGVSNVLWNISYGNDSVAKGGYSGAIMAARDVTLSGSGTTYTAATQTFRFAGSYTTKLTFQVGSTSYTYTSAPHYEVWSVTPTVTITGISQTGTFGVDMTDNCEQDDTDCSGNVTSNKNEHKDDGATASYTATVANVYFKCTRGSTIKGNHNYQGPSVTITLANIGVASQAELSFGADTYVYNGTTRTGSYIWTANGACVRNIGYHSASNLGTDTKTSAGTITANTLVLTYDGETYTVAIPTITINNPY